MPDIVLADANNKRKETKWAGIFSMQNVCFSQKTEQLLLGSSYTHTTRGQEALALASARGGEGESEYAFQTPSPGVLGQRWKQSGGERMERCPS